MNGSKLPPGFESLRNKAESEISDHTRVQRVVEKALEKANREKDRISRVWDELGLLVRLLKAWASRRYTALPVRTVALAFTALLYFVLPFDFIPDFIVGSGFLDDITVISFVVHSIRGDIEKFQKWENSDGEGSESQSEFREGIETGKSE